MITETEVLDWINNQRHETNFHVNFDWENYDTEASDFLPYKSLLGLQHYKGYEWFGVQAGGDWEFPVYLALFKVDDEIAVYIPKHPAVYDLKSNRAYDYEDVDGCSDNSLLEIRDNISLFMSNVTYTANSKL